MVDSIHSSLPFCDVMALVTTFPDEQQDLERISLTVLHSNVRLLCQAYDELHMQDLFNSASYNNLFNRNLLI